MENPKFVENLGQLPTTQERLSMSGLEFMLGMLEGRIPHPPIAKLLNYRLTQVESGRVTFRGISRFEHLNPMGTVHGGWFGTLLDSAMACAVMTRLETGTQYTTLEFKVNITRPLTIGAEVDTLGEVLHYGRSTAVAEARLVEVNGKSHAYATTTCMILR